MKEIYLPSAPHAALAKLAGEWDQTVELASKDGPPLRAHGRVLNRVVLGGRFVVSEGGAQQPDGALAYGSLLLFGFDGRSRDYTAIVLDTFGTYYVTAAGSAPPDGAPIVMRGETPERGGTKRFDVVLRWLDADTYRTEIVFHLPGREPAVAVAATCRRVTRGAGADIPRPVTFRWHAGARP
jgi:hypothetical protein